MEKTFLFLLFLKKFFQNPKNLFLSFLFLSQQVLFPQRSDFFDPYDYDIRNQKTQTLEDEKFKIYNLPPKRPTRPNINPKKVQKDLDPTLIIPQNTPFRTAPQNQNLNNSPVNIFTGELNTEQILKNEEEKRKAKEAKLKALENFEKPVYSESQFRRGEIIFFMTFPFALGLSAVVVATINYSQPGFVRTPTATWILGVGSVGLSLGNAYLDFFRYEEYMQEKRKNPHLERGIEFSLPLGRFYF
ncbi:MAG: hypothetical protein N3A69_16015 [Leptospiraceae bacterium]|nr:hypothetical protein [Leptospiraceae bacterium]